MSPSDIIISLGLYAAAAFRIMPSITRLVNSLISINHALPVINLLNKELNYSDNKVSETPDINYDNDVTGSFEKSLEIKNLNFSYNDQKIYLVKLILKSKKVITLELLVKQVKEKVH